MTKIGIVLVVGEYISEFRYFSIFCEIGVFLSVVIYSNLDEIVVFIKYSFLYDFEKLESLLSPLSNLLLEFPSSKHLKRWISNR